MTDTIEQNGVAVLTADEIAAMKAEISTQARDLERARTFAASQQRTIDLQASRHEGQVERLNQRSAVQIAEAVARAEKAELLVSSIQARACQEAENREWCGEFDNILVGLGLPHRARNYAIRVRITQVVEIDETDEEFTSEADARAWAERLSSSDLNHHADESDWEREVLTVQRLDRD